jgi:hypothetical protein
MYRWGLAASIGGLSAALALTGTLTPASAADPARSVTVSKDESIVVVADLTPGAEVRVEVKRNGIEIGSALGIAPPDGVFELNHAVATGGSVVPDPGAEENDTGTAVCWTDFTPHILGGDVVHVSSGGVDDEVVVTGIEVTQEPTKVDADTGIVQGRVDGPVPPIGELTVTTKGRTANDERFDGLAPGSSDGVTGKLKYIAPRKFQATFNGLSARQMGAFLDSADVRAIHESASSGTASHSTVATYGADARFTEDLCPPVARRAVTGTSLGEINQANVDGPLTVWGTSAHSSAVQVGIEDRNGTRRTYPAAISGTGIAQTWSVTYPAGALRGFADGSLTLSASFTGDAGVVSGGELTIYKDTVAPAGPRIRPHGGRFLRTVTIRLGAPGAREIWYTLNGDRPGPHRGIEYHGRFRLKRSATLRAIAYDAAGNASVVTKARFRRIPHFEPSDRSI